MKTNNSIPLFDDDDDDGGDDDDNNNNIEQAGIEATL
jgi:hypothetical protein